MESNNNNNIQAEHIYEAITNEDFGAIAQIINANPIPGSIYMILESLFDKLKNPSTVKSSEFCFNILEQLVNMFGIPIALWMNYPVIAEVFEDLLQKTSTRIRVNDLLNLCLSMFSFEQDSNYVPNLTDLFRKANPKIPLPQRTESPSFPFARLFNKKQKVIGDTEKLIELSPLRLKELPGKIEELLSTEDFENNNFNFLEQDLAIYYFNDLVRMLDVFEKSKEKRETVESEQVLSVKQTVSKENPALDERELRFRTSFYLYEKLEDENLTIEYKNYFWKFTEDIDFAISKVVCGLLNRDGGRIYVGVEDNSNAVVGIKLTSKQRDEAKLHILGLMRYFEPSNINTSQLVDIVYLPIINPINNQKIPELVVMKIIVKQGDASKLYSASKEVCRFYQRNSAQTVELRPGQIVDVLTERLLKPQKRLDESEFIDPKPEKLVDFANEAMPFVKNNVQFKKPFELKRQDLSASGFLKKATEAPFQGSKQQQPICVQIKGLPKGVPVEEAERYLRLGDFKNNITYKRIFYEKGLTNSGEGYVNFNSQLAAQNYVTYIMNSSPGKKHGITAFIKRA